MDLEGATGKTVAMAIVKDNDACCVLITHRSQFASEQFHNVISTESCIHCWPFVVIIKVFQEQLTLGFPEFIDAYSKISNIPFMCVCSLCYHFYSGQCCSSHPTWT